MTLRVALVDDHQPFRERLRALLGRDPDIEIVAEASSGPELLEVARATDIDVVCMDIRLPRMSGIETTRRLLAFRPKIRVIGLSTYAEAHYVETMLGAGAVGQFTKSDVSEALLHAIHNATAEHPLFGANVLVPESAHGASTAATGDVTPSSEATLLRPREVEILRQIARGLAPGEIAQSLSIDSTLVDVYRRNIMRKLHLTDEATLAEYARTRFNN